MKILFTALLLALASPPAAGAGVDGQWAAVLSTGSSGSLLQLKSDGVRLTGWLAEPNGKLEISRGAIQGNAITFELALSARGQKLTIQCKGELSGDELRLTMRTAGGPEEHLTMRRVDPGQPLERFSEAPAPAEVTAWLKANAIPLRSVEADANVADLMPLKARLAGARVVAIGEATHGTREFQQFKFRMFRFLVEQLGFTVFGIEGNWPESLSVNNYIAGGQADPTEGLGFGWWQTEDMMAFLDWMRKYNQDPAHTRKLKFYGVDMQTPRLAESNVLAYLRRVDPMSVGSAAKTFATLGESGENKQYEKASAEVKHGVAESLAALLRRFDDLKPQYIARTSLHDWTMARQNMVIVKQSEVKLGMQDERGTTYRDRAMAENAKWVLDQEPPGTKMMLWAHNGHVAAAAPLDAPEHLPLGEHLRRIFGHESVSCGFIFEQGGFRAVDMATNATSYFTVGPPPRGSIDATFAGLGLPLFALDLRLLPAGKVSDWFTSPHISRQIGGGYSEATPGVWMHKIRAAREFDLLIFIGKTTPSVPVR